MGAWGVGPLDNDTALDMVAAWKAYRAIGHSPEHSTPEAILDHFLGNQGQLGIGMTIDWGDVETTTRLIALAALFHRDGLEIRGKVKEYFEETLNWELRKDALAEWDDPKARKAALTELLAQIGGRRRRITRSRLFRHPAIEFKDKKELLRKLEPWVRGIAAHKLSEFPSDQEYPRLWQVLDRVMRNQLRHLNDDLLVDGTTQRLMLLAAYLGIHCRMTPDETMDLVRRAEKVAFVFFGHSTDLWQEYLTNRPPKDAG